MGKMPENESRKGMPHDGERLIQDALAELGWNADPSRVANHVRRLNIGLPAEDEFSMICAWLGRR